MQIRHSDRDRWYARPLGSERAPHLFRVESLGLFQQLAKGSVNQSLAVGRCCIEDAHVLRVGPLAVKAAQHIVGATKNQTREQLLTPTITGERTGLFRQRPDHVMIIDARSALAA